jgi:hypothetical protein
MRFYRKKCLLPQRNEIVYLQAGVHDCLCSIVLYTVYSDGRIRKMNKSNNQISVRLDRLAHRMTPNGIRHLLSNETNHVFGIWIYNDAFLISI